MTTCRRSLFGALLLAALATAMAGGRPDAPADAPAGKRVAAPVVAPLTLHGVRYEAPADARDGDDGQAGGYVIARDARSGRELWRLRIYATVYDPHLEQDVQDVYIRTLRAGRAGRTLEIVDERGRRYTLDLATRTVRPR